MTSVYCNSPRNPLYPSRPSPITNLLELSLPIIKSLHAVLIVNPTHQLAEAWIIGAVVDLSEFFDALFLEFVSDLGELAFAA